MDTHWRGGKSKEGAEWTCSIRRNGCITDACVTGGC